jgi:alkylation response protein AidB-like acyl-CoA dehydrogenase
MNLQWNEEQEMIRKMARDFGESEVSKALVRQMESDERGFPESLWKKMADLGWMGLPFPEEYGGSGAGFVDLLVLLEEMGRACIPGPFFSTVLLAGMSIWEGGREEQKKEFLPRIARGDQIATLALTEPDPGFEPSDVKAQAVLEKNHYRLNGTKLFVPDAHIADQIICVARTAEGITLLLADSRSEGIGITPLKTISGEKECEVVFRDVKIPERNVLGSAGKGWDAVDQVLLRARIAKSAAIVGMAGKMLDMTVEHAKQRVQFGRPIGSLQIIQTYCAQMMTEVETSRLMAYKAGWMVDRRIPCVKEASIAKGWASSASRRVAAFAQQIHGAIGFTGEYDLGLYYKRLKAAELALGEEEWHKERVARAMTL